MTPRLATALKALYIAAVAVTMLWVLFGLDQFSVRDALQAPGAIAFSACWFLMALSLGALWCLVVLKLFGTRLSARQWIPLQAFAWTGRYLPGKVGLLAGKIALVENGQLGAGDVTRSVLIEQLAFIAAGAILALVLISDIEFLRARGATDMLVSLWNPIRATGGVAVLAGMMVAIRVLAPARATTLGRAAVFASVFLALYMVPHLLAGAGLHVFIVGISQETGTIGPAFSIALAATASVLGVLAFFAPAGLGVRELVIAGGLAPWLPWPQGLAVAALLRVISVLSDVLFLALGALIATAARRSGRHLNP